MPGCGLRCEKGLQTPGTLCTPQLPTPPPICPSPLVKFSQMPRTCHSDLGVCRPEDLPLSPLQKEGPEAGGTEADRSWLGLLQALGWEGHPSQPGTWVAGGATRKCEEQLALRTPTTLPEGPGAQDHLVLTL